ncbi:MAG: hypothetical protein ACYTBJ_07670, partial [Planctomycetota bacterium]
PLLEQVSEITGGRVLVSDPNQAELFDYSGVKFPETHLPLTRPLMFVWLCLFLLDVAVRRVAVDFRAAGRSVVSFVRSLRPQRKADQTLERLRLTRRKLREQLSVRPKDAFASRRYEAGEQYSGELPAAKVAPKMETPPAKPAEKAESEKVKPEMGAAHIQQLLKAKRKATDRRQGGGTENKE